MYKKLYLLIRVKYLITREKDGHSANGTVGSPLMKKCQTRYHTHTHCSSSYAGFQKKFKTLEENIRENIYMTLGWEDLFIQDIIHRYLVRVKKLYNRHHGSHHAASQDVYKYFRSPPCGNIEWVHFLTFLNLCKDI